jgi:hypothetical protein
LATSCRLLGKNDQTFEKSRRRTRPADGLPAAAFDALAERVVDLVDKPWDASVMPPGDDPAFRMTVFGTGNGLLSFHADDTAEIIRIFDITWIS